MIPTEEEFQKLLVRIETMLKRYERREELLKRALPFIITHWQTSRFGTGQGAQMLMNEIKAELGMK